MAPKLLLDGGLATELERKGFDLSIGKLWSARLLDECPELIEQVHLSYLEAGANIITSSSYQASFDGFLEEGYSLSEAKELMIRSVQLCKRARSTFQNFSPSATDCYVAASCGPYGAYLADGSEYRGCYGVSKERLLSFHSSRLEVLVAQDPDFIAFETIPDIEEAQAIIELMTRKYFYIPFWISIQCRNETEMACGTSIETIVPFLCSTTNCFAIGVNCVPPQYISSLISIIRNQLLRLSLSTFIIAYPNSGEVYNPLKKDWNQEMKNSIQSWVDYMLDCDADVVGGCCRTTPLHIQLLKNQICPSTNSS
ncbi:homocysteine S-methyltransferase [Galdieria sulphuraria]|uniref:Homocysteine S-methyltransferase n=1 Tax=Galdieria sulphuraria TaxID=130081 RepID=M2W396_GALSU|nr:homocysteine S-methyltransferase [Galdieria sulphuraria]EME30171.1 homocysteine S-methyltransferase [Galdieria sulphuraria]|eukprot:XP_005706691.1 homocysteine S-methyltransferase [Galdieria sulphuraria]